MPQRVYTMLDVRLGLVELTEEQKEIIRTKVLPVFVEIARRELAKWMAENAEQAHHEEAAINGDAHSK